MSWKTGQKIIDKIRGKNDRRFKRESYSQDGEDLLLASFLDENSKGFYVDIGAHHPLRFSNTHYYYLKGWCGINIDGPPGSMVAFNKIRKRDINIETVISDNDEKVTYYLFKEPALNTFDRVTAELYIKQGCELLAKKELKTSTIEKILDKYVCDRKINFINLDVEGVDESILRTFNFDKYAPEYFLVEDTRPDVDFFNSEIYKFMSSKGYKLVARTFRTSIYKKG